MKKKLLLLFTKVIFIGTLAAQTDNITDATFYKSRILAAPGSVFKKFVDAGMNPTDHTLTEAEQEQVAKAFSLLPPLYSRILKAHLHSISFMDNMPNTALTSPVETADSIKKFNITFRSGILNETVTQWATWKEQSLYDFTTNPGYEIQIDAGDLDALVYVLLHEATHVIDAVLQLTPHTENVEAAMIPTPYTKDIWLSFNVPVPMFTNATLEKPRFRSGKVQPVTAAKGIYQSLEKTPFASLYGMASCYEDIAEFITIYHLTEKLNQPYVVYVKKNGKTILKFEPMTNKLVKKRTKQLNLIYS